MNKENKHNKELVLSILIPSFNDEDYIKQCLESILMNISEEFEVILNDDCSDDKTLEIANSFNDPRLKCNLAHTKLGTVDNWKKCCHLAKGKYAKHYRGHTLEDLSKLLDIPVGTLEAWKTHYV